MLLLWGLLLALLAGCAATPSLSVDRRLGQLQAQADEALQRGDFQAAESVSRNGLDLARRNGRESAEGRFLLDLSRAQEGAGRYRLALSGAHEGLKLARALGDRALEASAGVHLGLVYRRLGQYPQALAVTQEGLAVARAVGDPALESEGLRNLGAVDQAVGHPDQALAHYQDSLKLARSASDRAGEAKTLNDLGGLYRLRADYSQALRHYQQSLALKESVGDRGGAGRVLGNICLLYQNLRDFRRALDYCERSLAIARKSGDRPREANNLNNIGAIYRALGEYPKALDYYQRSVEAKRALADRAGEARGLNNIGELYWKQGDTGKAVDYLSRSLRIKEAIGDRPGQSASRYDLGLVYLEARRYDQAIEQFQRAWLLQTEIGQPEVLWRAMDGLSRTYAALSKPLLAIFFGKQAVNTIQSVRANIADMDEALQRSFLEDKMGVYRRLIDLLIRQGRLLEAQQVMAMLKEEEYFDFVRREADADARRTRVGYDAPEQPWNERYQRIAAKLVELGEEERVLKSKDEAALSTQDRERLVQLDADLEVASQAFNAMLDELKAAFQQLDKARGEELAQRQFDTGRMGMVRDLGPGTVLLQYILLQDGLRVLLTTASVQKPYRLPTGESEINPLTCRLLEALRSPNLDPRPLAKVLYDLLIAPLAEDLEQAHAKTLMVSLDGVLRYVPLAALYDGRHYLAERYALAVYIEPAADRLKDPPKATWSVAGFGVTQALRDFPALQGVRAELEGIVKEQGRSGGVLDGTIRLDRDFTQQELRRALSPRYPVVHVASHFRIGPTETEAFLLLGDGSALTLEQIRTGRYDFQNVDLLTLSACETAVGSGQGREVEGLAVTAEKKGTKGVLATLWPVADQTTAALMQRIYALREGERLNKAEALRRAQLELLQGKLGVPPSDQAATGARGQVLRLGACSPSGAQAPPYVPDPAKPYAHPYYWAPFILMGNWL
jgi:CHAT domain-containing protein